MKKMIWIGAIMLIAVLALGGTGLALAQDSTPPAAQGTTPPGGGYGRGMMGGWGRSMSGTGGYGPMHETMVAAAAEALGLTVDEVNEALANGETLWTLAEAQGMSQEDFSQVMLDARSQALDEAVAAGTITQEQADLMREHWQTMAENGFTPGAGCHGAGAGRGMMSGFRGRGGMMGGWGRQATAPQS